MKAGNRRRGTGLPGRDGAPARGHFHHAREQREVSSRVTTLDLGAAIEAHTTFPEEDLCVMKIGASTLRRSEPSPYLYENPAIILYVM
jgi:hypothetical protein